ncbi:hypothetical protein K2173_022811 [Erythroxylum novogranatense]|uniref:Ribosomal RNA small subunit methyltransferase G n=1 Tax=Erythroxylum novogranatense TaxID=1862640 RepID=A0AAV8SNU7_9ROSI|nr:hypothetical protein K2173_022811 [Erythroxylum novogranatense]
MMIWRSKIPSVSFPLSFGTFVEHFPISRIQVSSISRRINAKSLSTAGISKSSDSSFFQALSDTQKDQIHLYVEALLEWNQRMNLTAVTVVEDVMERHVEDSLALIPPITNCYSSPCNKSANNVTLVDVGTGAGLPGLILAIACPDWRITLLESMNKRCVFLEHAVSFTGLSNVKVVRGRAESIAHNVCFREKFDVAVARAVAEMRILAEYCLPLVRVGGLFVAAKGHDPQEEVRNAERSIQLMGASVLQLCSVQSQSPFGRRSAIICSKDRPTPRKYPRDPVATRVKIKDL